jgi:hypothetical protein
VERVVLSWIGKFNVTELDRNPMILDKRNRISSIGHFCPRHRAESLSWGAIVDCLPTMHEVTVMIGRAEPKTGSSRFDN